VYSTCLFCHSALGANDVVEHFPVGRRLAFDSAKGRLWVVCARCNRWNLTPIEERWEAIEECTRAFRDQRRRMSTDNIGVARVGDGIDLVRIGKPLRSELVAWRYGDRLVGRYRSAMRLARASRAIYWLTIGLPGPILAATVSSVGGRFLAAVALGAVGGISTAALSKAWVTRGVVHLRHGERVIAVRAVDVPGAALRPDPDVTDSWGLMVRHRDGETMLTGEAARRAGAQILTQFNWAGGRATDVQDAADIVADAGDPERYLRRIARATDISPKPGEHLTTFGPAQRLAVEMALHEESERRAAEGELAALEGAWREAEEIAAIADNLFLPDAIRAWMRAHARE
jgi:hypothetical protein